MHGQETQGQGKGRNCITRGGRRGIQQSGDMAERDEPQFKENKVVGQGHCGNSL